MHMCMHMHMHMCLQTVWESAVAAGEAYYPPTYEADDHYTVTPTQPACLHFRGWVRLLPSWTCGHGCQSSGRVYLSRSEQTVWATANLLVLFSLLALYGRYSEKSVFF